jgi:magnesium-transporting ATPase (P-type)
LMAAIAVALFLLAVPAGATGASPELARAQTLAVTSVAFFQIFYLLVCRTLTAPLRSIGYASNPYVFAGIGVLLVLQIGFVHLPVMQALFRTADLAVTDWLLAAAAGAIVIPVVAAEKRWRRTRGSTGYSG